MGKRELVALLNLSSLCPVMVERLFLTVPQGCLRFVFAVSPDHTHYFLLIFTRYQSRKIDHSLCQNLNVVWVLHFYAYVSFQCEDTFI